MAQRIPPPLLLCLLALGISLFVCSTAFKQPWFSPDDYRYLSRVLSLAQGLPVPDALVVENRWDNHWWIPDGTYVRFFRPFVLPSYCVDYFVWGLNPGGFVLTNVLLHLFVTAALFYLVLSLTNAKASAFVGALTYGTHGSEVENIFYIAGRTDTIATLFFCLSLVAYLRYQRHSTIPNLFIIFLCCFLAYAGKEYCLLLPLVFLLTQYFIFQNRGLKESRAPIAAGIASAIFYAAFRNYFMGPAGSGGQPWPYFHLPAHPGFPSHAALTLLSYCCSLVWGTPVPPFIQNISRLWQEISPLGVSAALITFLLLNVLTIRSAIGRWCILCMFITTAPLIILYASSRYLSIPSLFYSIMVALLVSRAWPMGSQVLRGSISLLMGLLILIPALKLHHQLERAGTERRGSAGKIVSFLSHLEQKALLPKPGTTVYVLDFPGPWVDAQFLPFAAHVLTGVEATWRILTQAPQATQWIRLTAHRNGPTITTERGSAPLHQPRTVDFTPASVKTGDFIARPDYNVTVLEARDGNATKASFQLTQTDFSIILCVFSPKNYFECSAAR